jgi:hypothetical protein
LFCLVNSRPCIQAVSKWGRVDLALAESCQRGCFKLLGIGIACIDRQDVIGQLCGPLELTSFNGLAGLGKYVVSTTHHIQYLRCADRRRQREDVRRVAVEPAYIVGVDPPDRPCDAAIVFL